jgi:ribosomal-protein-alanine N-acetyltransferase
VTAAPPAAFGPGRSRSPILDTAGADFTGILGGVPRTTILTTPRLVLTTWVPTDVGDLLVVHSDPETMRFVRRGRPETRQETEELVRVYRMEQAGRGWTRWRLADRHGELVGRAGFTDHGNGRQLGYTIRRELWGRGLASEIAGALVQWHRDHASTETLWAYAAVENAPSCRVLEKVGFVLDSQAQHGGMPCHLYRLP